MEKQEIYDKVVTIVADHFELDSSKVSGELNFLSDIEADSIDFVELALEMEDAFDTQISDEAAEKLITINNTVDYIFANQK